MIQRSLALVIASFVLPIAGGAAIESGTGTLPPGTVSEPPASQALRTADPFAANGLTQQTSTERIDAHNAVTPVTPVTEAPSAAMPTPSAIGACPDGMALVEGDYCTEVRHDCKRWLDDPKLQFARCAEYEQPARCVGQRVRMRYCIDRHEYTAPGEQLPMNHASFVVASKTCKAAGKRICTESEWNFACEGEPMQPYPYGFSREPKCNQDRADLYEQTPRKRLLKDHRQPAGANPECVSPFGVFNMVGNLDEPVLREIARHNQPFRNGLKGGWWMAGRNRCRPATTAHDDYYQDIQVGVRCCADSDEGTSEPSG